MFFIKTKFQETVCGYNDLFDEIDRKINQLSTILLENYKYAFDKKVNYNTLDDLLTYKSILKIKLDCNSCLQDYSLDFIISKIRKLTNSIC